jgi:hypothetical protein
METKMAAETLATNKTGSVQATSKKTISPTSPVRKSMAGNEIAYKMRCHRIVGDCSK